MDIRAPRKAAWPALAAAALITLYPLSAAASDWAYTSADGSIPPVDWGAVDRLCGAGRSQSPIAISPSTLMPGDGIAPPMIHYGKADLSVFNTGHTIEAEVDHGAGYIEIDGALFDLVQFHIHWRSEHFVDGNAYRAELHLVHEDSEGNLAVLGLFLRGQKAPNLRLRPFFNAATRLAAKGDRTHVGGYDLNRLVPLGDPGFYHYSGSLTTPPCTEGVSWWLWNRPQGIGVDQRAKIRVGIPRSRNPQGNRRPPQSLNGRRVFQVEN